MIGFLLMILLSGVLIILSIFAILLFRNVAIVLLVIVAPIAFACAILPNTKKLFDKWWSMFRGMLILYPTIAILFGGCKLGATIIGNANLAIGSTGQALAVLGISVIPLIATPAIMKGALKSLDALGGNIGSKLGERTMGSAQKFAGNHIKASGKNAWQNSSVRHFGYQARGKIGDKMAHSRFANEHSTMGRPFRRVGNTWKAQGLQQNRQRQNFLEGRTAIATADAETEKANDAWAKDLSDKGKITNDMALEALGKGTFMGKKLDEGQKVALIKQGAFKSIKGVHDKLWVLEQNDGMDHHDGVDHNTAGSYAFRKALISGAKDAGVAGIGGGAVAGYSSADPETGKAFDSREFAVKTLSGSDSKTVLASGDVAQYAAIANGADVNQVAGGFASANAKLTSPSLPMSDDQHYHVDAVNGGGAGDKALHDLLRDADKKYVQDNAKSGVTDDVFKVKQDIDTNEKIAENARMVQQSRQQAIVAMNALQKEADRLNGEYQNTVNGWTDETGSHEKLNAEAQFEAKQRADAAQAAVENHKAKWGL